MSYQLEISLSSPRVIEEKNSESIMLCHQLASNDNEKASEYVPYTCNRIVALFLFCFLFIWDSYVVTSNVVAIGLNERQKYSNVPIFKPPDKFWV